MYDFFILGQVPGTSFVVTFWMWIELAALVVTFLYWASYRRYAAVRSYVPPTIGSDPGTLQSAIAR